MSGNCAKRTLWVIGLFAAGIAADASLFRTPCFVQCVTDTSAVICWQWEKPTGGLLVYGTSTHYGDTISLSPSQRFDLRLTGLQPNTRYHYNLLIQGKTILTDSRDWYFHTAPTDIRESVVFAVIGDTRSGDESFHSDHRAVIESILRYTYPSFLLHTGDLVDFSQSDRWEKFFDIEGDLLRQCPVYPVRGNSDVARDEFGKIFHLPDTTEWYSFSYGPVHAIALDIQFKKTDRHYRQTIGPQSRQYAWLVKQLQSEHRKAHPFTIVFFCAPLFRPDGRDDSYLIRQLCPLFERYRVDCVINGGVHYFAYAKHGDVAYVISGGGGAVLERPRKKLSKHVRFFHSAFHHLRMAVHYPTLTIEAIDNSGSVFFSHALTSRSVDEEEAVNVLAGDSLSVRPDDLLVVTIYGTQDCGECALLKDEILPRIQRSIYPHKLQIDFTDVDNEENYKKYVSLESRMGTRKHSFPVVSIADTLLSGDDLSEQTLQQTIRGVLPVPRDDERKPTREFLISVSIGLLALMMIVLAVIAIFHVRKRKRL